MSNTKKDKFKEKEHEKPQLNFFYQLVIYTIIITFVVYGGVLLGFRSFIQDLSKTKTINEDGTISIEQDAQTLIGNQENRDVYIGKVFGEKIRLGIEDEFNYNIARIANAKELNYNSKIYYIRNAFDYEISKIISKFNAKKMGFAFSDEYIASQVGKKYYADSNGEVDYARMKKDTINLNKYAEAVYGELITSNFNKDFFQGLPISYDEMWNIYKLEKLKISYNYINILKNNVDEIKIKNFFENNKNDYMQYKLTRLIFNKNDQEIANGALREIKKDPSKFIEIGNKLKEDNKIINIIYDSLYTFINDFENYDFKETLRRTGINEISDSYVETEINLIVFKVNDKKHGDLNNPEVKNLVKSDYLKNNQKENEIYNNKLADDLYNYAKKNGFESAAKTFNARIESTNSLISFSEDAPFLRSDVTDDMNFKSAIFKSDVNTMLPLYRHSEGYMIVKITNKEKPSNSIFENMADQLEKQYVTQKVRILENEYFSYERKKNKIVDNFKYVNWQALLSPTQVNK